MLHTQNIVFKASVLNKPCKNSLANNNNNLKSDDVKNSQHGYSYTVKNSLSRVSTIANLVYFGSNTKNRQYYIPDRKETTLVKHDAINRLKPKAESIIYDVENIYVPKVKEYLHLYELGLKKESIFSKRKGIKALRNLPDYEVVDSTPSGISIKRKSDGIILNCTYLDKYLSKIDVVDADKDKDGNTVTDSIIYLYPKNIPPIVRIFMKTQNKELDFVDFTFDQKEPKLATYTVQSEPELTNIIYNSDHNAYTVNYSIPPRELENGAIFPRISGYFQFDRI